MKRRNRILKSILGTFLSVSLLAPTAASLMPPMRAEAKTSEVTYEYYTTVLGNEVPECWLFVGTYLMSAKSLSAEIYQAALDSRAEHDQPIAYYSSELDGGAWKNIEGASSITTILPAAEKVKEKDLYPYLVTVVVDDDGIPRDPVTEEPVDIYTSTSLYDMENLPELEALYNYYLSGGVSYSDTGSKNYMYRMLFFFFENDDLDFDRAALDASEALAQYKQLVMDRTKLEDVWDKALTTDPSAWDAEYSQIMQVMRNWPNIRDDVTDRADREEELLGKLFISLQEQDLNEEADSALYVERQIDAARRARIYYNLTLNENLTGSYGVGIDEELEALQLEDAELRAYLAQLALDIDKAESEVKKVRQAIYDLEDDNEAQQQAIDAEKERWAALDNETKLDNLNAELSKLQEAFVPIEAEYKRLDAELEEAYNASVNLNNDQTALSDEIDALNKQKEEKTAEYNEKIAALEKTLSELKTRKTKAEGRRSESEEACAERDSLQKDLDRLYATIEAEEEKLAAYTTDSETYTSSRTTANADKSKVYDPQKKQEADRNVSRQQKLVNALESSAAGVCNKINSLSATLNSISNDMNLDEEIAQAQKALDDAQGTLPDILDRELAEIELQIKKKQESLAAMSDPYQEKLKVLKVANDAYNGYLETYQKAKQALEDKRLEVMAVEDEIDAHDALIDSCKDKIDANNSLIKAKEAIIPVLQAPVDRMDEDYVKTEEIQKEVEAVIKDLQGGSITPYDARIKATKLIINLTCARVDQVEEEKKKLEDADKELENAYKQKLLDIDNAKKYREEDAPAAFEESKKSLEEKYDSSLKELEQQKEELKEQKRQALLDHEAAMAEDPQIKKLDELLSDAQEKCKNALELKDAVTAFKIADEKLKTAKMAYDEADAEYQKVYAKYSKQRMTLNLFRSLNLTLARNRREDAKKALDQMQKTYDDALAKLQASRALCSDYSGADNDEASAAAYYSDKKTDADIARQQSRSAKEAMIEEYRLIGERWDAKIAEMDPKLETTKEQKEAALSAAESEFIEAQERRLTEIQALEKESEELMSKRAGNKLERNRKDERIDYLQKEIERYKATLSEYQAKQQALAEEGNFGVAPVLTFLKDAAESGRPDMGRRYSDMAAYRGESFVETQELSVMIQDAYTACLASYDTYTKKSMKITETPAEYAGYILSRRAAQTADNEAACIPYLQMLTDLRNIEASESEHPEREMSFLYTWLLPFAITDFNSKRNTETMDTYHRYLKAVTDRDTPENGIIYIEGRLEYAKSLKNSFINGNRKSLIESHILFLEGLLETLKSRLDGETEDKDLSDYEKQLYEEKEKALSENDPSRAKMIDALLEGLQAQGAFNSEGSGEGVNPEDDRGLSSDVTDRPLPQSEIVEVVLDELNNENLSLDTHLGKLEGLPGGVGDLAQALDKEGQGDKFSKEIQNAMVNATPAGGDYGSGPGTVPGGNAGQTDIGSSTAGDGSGNNGGEGGSGTEGNGGSGTGDPGSSDTGGDSGSGGGGSGNGDGPGERDSGGDKGEGEDYSNIDRGDAQAALGPVFDGLDPEGQAALVAALAEAAQNSGNDDLLQYAKDLLDELLKNKNTAIYKQYLPDKSREYVSLAAMDKCRRASGFRYVRRGSTVTMSQLYRGSASYSFTIGTNKVVKNNGDEGQLSVNAAEQADNYIRPGSSAKYGYLAEGDALKYLGCGGVYIQTTDWAILITPGMEKTIEEVAEILNTLAEQGKLDYNPGQ